MSVHLPPISKAIQIRRTKYTEHCLRNRDEITRSILLWQPKHGHTHTKYMHQLSADIWQSLEVLTGAMDNRDRWLERVKGPVISARLDNNDDDWWGERNDFIYTNTHDEREREKEREREREREREGGHTHTHTHTWHTHTHTHIKAHW